MTAGVSLMSSSPVQPLIAALEHIYVEETLAGLNASPHLGTSHKGQLRHLIRGGAEPREIADTHYLALHEHHVHTLMAERKRPGIRTYWTDMRSLQVANPGTSEAPLSMIRQHISFTHPLADRVLAVTFGSPEDFFALIPAQMPYSTFSFLLSLQDAWESHGIHVLQISDQRSGRLLIPSLSLIEAIVRSVDNPLLNLYITSEEVEPALYKALWALDWCPVALLLKRLLLPEIKRILEPAAYAEHDLLHLVNRDTTSRNLGLIA